MSANRILVHSAAADELRGRFVAKAAVLNRTGEAAVEPGTRPLLRGGHRHRRRPVVLLIRFDEDDQAVKMANDTTIAD